MAKILLTDGANKNTLSILRSLAKKGHIVDVTSTTSKLLTLCSYSKYCNKTILIKCDVRDSHEYYNHIVMEITKSNYDYFIPVGLHSCKMASKNKDNLKKHVKLLVADWDSMKIASDKEGTMSLASSLGIPIPATRVVLSSSDINIIGYPVVLKSSDESGKFVKYCNDEEELIQNFDKLNESSETNIICQEYIRGFGCGFFAVCQSGQPITSFMHKRILEFPTTGGPSAVAAPFYDERLQSYGSRLCSALKWDGPIMAEFKYDSEMDDYKLIEINPKLWGSLDLSIAAGMDVAQAILDLCDNKHASNRVIRTDEFDYFRWVFPDEFRVLMARLSLKELKRFLTFTSRERLNIDFSDPLPTMFQIIRSLVDGLHILVNEERKYPHGIPGFY